MSAWCDRCGRRLRTFEELETGICFRCFSADDFDADELGLDPEEEYDA